MAGCAAGKDANCELGLHRLIDKKLTKVDLPCLIHAETKAAIRACKAVACP